MKETGLTGKVRSTTIAATPDDGKSHRKRRRRSINITIDDMLSGNRPLVDLYMLIPNWCLCRSFNFSSFSLENR